jgi:hypothetical protein
LPRYRGLFEGWNGDMWEGDGIDARVNVIDG